MRKLEHAEIIRPSLRDLEHLPRLPLAVVLENLRSAHNVGSILRTADAVRAAHIYLTGHTPSGTHPSVRKTALGAQDSVPWTSTDEAVVIAQEMKREGYTLIALEITDDPIRVETLDPGIFPACLMVGNEVFGISDPLLDLCDVALELPQYGFKQSLNVSVAAGIALYDLLRLYLSHSISDSFLPSSEDPPL